MATTKVLERKKNERRRIYKYLEFMKIKGTPEMEGTMNLVGSSP
jgi:hypothetical protein